MAETAKHTPGPWEVRQGFYIGRPGRMSLAQVNSGDIPADDTEQHKANARLIAAAPDLLEACLPIIEHFDKWGVDAPMISRLKAAVAKATDNPSSPQKDAE